MPCDQIVLCRIEIAATNADLLTLALESLIENRKWARSRSETIRQQAERIIKQGFISLSAGQEYIADEIKREYSRQVVLAASRKLGWRVYQKTPQKLAVTRRV